MDFSWDSEQQAFRSTVRDFLAANLPSDWESLAHGPGSEAQSAFSKTFCAAARRSRLARAALAEALGRPRRRSLDGLHPRRGNVGGGRAARRPVHERELDRSDVDALRLGGTAGALHPADGARRDDLVSGILRARSGLRPRLVAHARGARRRELPHQRPEDLDLVCRRRRHLFPARAHVAWARRHLHLPRADGHARHHRARDSERDRRGRHSRSVLRRRRGAGHGDARRRRQGLGNRAHRVVARTRRHSALRAGDADAQSRSRRG